MPVQIRATMNKPSFDQIRQRIQERRAVLENARSMSVRRVRNDLDRISKREGEYIQKLIEEIIPVKVSWKEDAAQKLAEFLPFTVEPLHVTETEDKGV